MPPISVERKRALGNEVVQTGMTAYSVSRTSRVHYKSVQRYSNKVKLGLPIFAGSGRPPALAEDDFQSLVDFIQMNNDATRREIVSKIRELAGETWRKRHEILRADSIGGDGDEERPRRKLSWRTIDRYIIKARIFGQILEN